MGVQEVDPPRDVQRHLLPFPLPHQLPPRILVQRRPQVAPSHVLRGSTYLALSISVAP